MATILDEIEKELSLNAWNKDRAILVEHAIPIIRDIAERWGIKRLALYGSFISDKEKPSDIDIMIECENLGDLYTEKMYIIRTSKPLDIQFSANALFNMQFGFFYENTQKRYGIDVKGIVIAHD